MIVDSVNFARAQGKRVIYDAEHFFDAWRDDPGYALECLRAAVAAGRRERDALRHQRLEPARPGRRGDGGRGRRARRAGRRSASTPTTTLECGVANSLAAVEAGARIVQGTINGYGERCGNANLVSILPALQLKLGYECVPADRLRLLTETAHFVDELTNTTPDPDQPYVGRNAFAHKGGMHVAGVQADARTFEHMDPKLVGNSRDVLISELSGKGSVLSRAENAGIDLDADAAKRAVERIKEREHRGYHYEAADASFDLLLRREAGEYQPLFRLESFRVITEKRADGQVETEATIKIWVDGRRYVRTAEGNGPVNALDRALRDAIGELHPAPRRHRAGRLQGPDPRLPPRHRRGHPRAARLRPTATTRGARSASRRTSSRRPGRRWWIRSSTRSRNPQPRTMARPVLRFRAGRVGVSRGTR